MSEPVLRGPVAQDAARCFALESSAYEGGEAATFAKIARRIADYPEGFLVLELDGQIVGFVNSGCAHEVVMSDEGLKELLGHDPAAPNVVLLSVVVAPEHQGKGYARLLLDEFARRMRARGKRTIHLLCKQRHVALYGKLGYTYVRPSDSHHRGMSWHEMAMELVPRLS